MNRWKFRTGIVLLFVAGIVIGASATGWWYHRATRGWHGSPEKVQTRILDFLGWQLSLSEPQKAGLAPVVRDVFDRVNGIRRRVWPEIEGVLEEGLQRAKPTLSGEQYEKLEKRYQRIKRYWHGPE